MYNDNDRRVKHFLRISSSLVHPVRMCILATALMFDDDDRNTEKRKREKRKKEEEEEGKNRTLDVQ